MRRPAKISVLVVLFAAFAIQAHGQAPAFPKLPPVGAPQPTPAGTPQANPFVVPGQPDWTEPKDYADWLAKYFRIFKIPKYAANLVGPKRVHVNHPLSADFELVREDKDFYYLRNLPLEDPDSRAHKDWLRGETDQIRQGFFNDYIKDKYIVVNEDEIYPPFTDKVSFVRRDVGLPKGGRLQMSFGVGDFNGDGLLDIVVPPQRGGYAFPMIYLQQKDGSFRYWNDVKWPAHDAAPLDYGSVRVADFDGDGNLDIAIACHFKPAFVLYGNGKGDFTRFVRLPDITQGVTSRGLAVADFNGDGRPDLALLAELDVEMGGKSQRLTSGLVRVLLNLPTGWKPIGEGFPNEIMGDVLTTADLDRDGLPDLVLTSRKEGIRNLIYRNAGKGEKWEEQANLQMPYNAYVLSAATGSLDRFPSPDVVMCFEQFNPRVREDPTQACVIYHFHDEYGNVSLSPVPRLFLKEKHVFKNFNGVAVGDLDGDGRNDIAVLFDKATIRVFLQFPDGNYYEQRAPELAIADTELTDIQIVDLDHSGVGSIVVMGTPSSSEKSAGGGVWVFKPQRKVHAAK